MSDAARRAIRTFAQVSVVTAFVQLLLAFDVPITAAQQAAIVAFATPFLVFAQNFAEDHTSMPALLKNPASGGQNPMPNDAGAPPFPPATPTDRCNS